MSQNEAKNKLRRDVLSIRRTLTPETIQDNSRRMAEHLWKWPPYQQAQTVMMFVSMKDEPQMNPMILKGLEEGKTVCIPHMYETYGMMDAAQINGLQELVVGKMGLMVPNPATLQIVVPPLIDLVIVPGVAFDHTGNRIGMGAGYYDRFLLQAPQATLIGIASTCQIVPLVPTDEYDQLMDYLLTEEGILKCGKGKI